MNQVLPLLRWAVFLSCGLFAGPPALSEQPLPEGRSGLAANHPGDRGIEADAAVVFADGFEAASVEAVAERWGHASNTKIMSLSEDVPHEAIGGKSLQFTHVGGRSIGGHLYRQLQPGHERLFYRFYVKFDEKCWPIHHFFHVGGYNPPVAWPLGGAGERPRGDERFTVAIEPYGEQWRWDYYVYWKDMRGSPPRGLPWGNSFIHTDATKIKLGRWTCVETMVSLNQLGRGDGELALWIDGDLVSHVGPGFPKGLWEFDKFTPGRGGVGMRWDEAAGQGAEVPTPEGGSPFGGFEWRTDPALDLNFLWLLVYITDAPRGHVSKVWFDNVVVAREYIGPVEPEG